MKTIQLLYRGFCPLLALFVAQTVFGEPAQLSLKDAVARAQQQDPWIQGSLYRQQALEAQSTSASALPDPMVTAGFANLPTNTFNFDQEPMTQFRVGVSQALPRGDSRALQQQKLSLMGDQHPYQRADRRAQVEAEVSGLWLDAWLASQTMQLIEQDTDLFIQLVDIAESSYVNSIKGARQQDLVHAQLELTRLEDRLVSLREQQDVAVSQLSEWLQSSDGSDFGSVNYTLPQELPQVTPMAPQLFEAEQAPTPQSLAMILREHPALKSVDQRLAASSTSIKLAQQNYRPEWRLNASYGYRDDDPVGQPRADFFSFGVSFDLPLFTSNRQDQQVISATANTESLRTDRALLLRKMVSQMTTLHARLQRLNERQALYQTRLLLDMSAQVDATMDAYTNDDGDFTEVVRARIDELNTQIDALNIAVNRQKTIAQLNYFFASSNYLEGQ
ncbi:TolC family protein [Congregibacter variabilis]|uniref:TolC family protein n=1 Tax=Congregibacter variabilis TaxID=3081200 RepID=A0ABZ0I6C3_9GAMM|nr:TolC family protein [Congregibacter sp. IMCC43200]